MFNIHNMTKPELLRFARQYADNADLTPLGKAVIEGLCDRMENPDNYAKPKDLPYRSTTS